LSFGVVISLLIGVSYNGSNATSSSEEREWIDGNKNKAITCDRDER